MSACIFWAISAGDAAASRVYDDDTCAAVMDIAPVNPGHVIVMPKEHVVGLDDLDEETGARLFSLVTRIARALRQSPIRSDGLNVFASDGEAAGQEVFHFHIHVLPRFDGDPFRIYRDGGWSQAPRHGLDRLASQIREALP